MCGLKTVYFKIHRKEKKRMKRNEESKYSSYLGSKWPCKGQRSRNFM